MGRIFYKDIKEQLLGLIAGRRPGDRLPSQTALSRRFGANHMTVRRALSELNREGYIYTVRGKGSFVKKRVSRFGGMHFLIVTPAIKREKSYLSTLVGGLLEEAWERGITLSLMPPSASPAELLGMLDSQKFSGVIWAKPGMDDEEAMEDVLLRGCPVMAVNRIPGKGAVNYVSVDHRMAAYDMASALMDRGHSRIALIPDMSSSPWKERRAGFFSAVEDNSGRVERPPEIRAEGIDRLGGGFSAGIGMMLDERKPTALFVAAMDAGEAAVDAARMNGLSIPGDIEIAVFDEVPEGMAGKGCIHEVIQPVGRLGREAVVKMHEIALGLRGYAREVLAHELRVKGRGKKMSAFQLRRGKEAERRLCADKIAAPGVKAPYAP